jgi:hypothetical protein
VIVHTHHVDFVALRLGGHGCATVGFSRMYESWSPFTVQSDVRTVAWGPLCLLLATCHFCASGAITEIDIAYNPA